MLNNRQNVCVWKNHQICVIIKKTYNVISSHIGERIPNILVHGTHAFALFIFHNKATEREPVLELARDLPIRWSARTLRISHQQFSSVQPFSSSTAELRARAASSFPRSISAFTHTVHSVFTCLRLSWCVCACLWVCARVWFKNLCMYKCVLAAHEHQNRGPYAINQFLQILLPEHSIGCGCFVNGRANYIYQQHNRHMCPHSQTNPYIHPHPHTHTHPHPRRAPETAKRPRPRHYQ